MTSLPYFDKLSFLRFFRMDRTNRTLLGKVKEHMKGRNYAEKQLNNLQGEHNTLKLALTDLRLKCNSQDELIQNLRNQCKEEVKLRLELEETVKQVTVSETSHKINVFFFSKNCLVEIFGSSTNS